MLLDSSAGQGLWSLDSDNDDSARIGSEPDRPVDGDAGGPFRLHPRVESVACQPQRGRMRPQVLTGGRPASAPERRDGVVEQAADVAELVSPFGDDPAAVDDHIGDVSRRGREHDLLGGAAGACGRSRGVRRRGRPRAPAAIRPASGQPRLAWPSIVSACTSSAGRNRPRCNESSRSCISRPRASSSRSITACWSLPRLSPAPLRSARAGPMPSARSRSVVGQKHAVVRPAPADRCRPPSGGWRARQRPAGRGTPPPTAATWA